jgi:hypothetical protein
VRKLISISLIIALLVTFLVPVAVSAEECDCGDLSQEDCDEYCENCAECGPDMPCPMPTPPCTTDTVGGALLWSLLGTSAIMGRAVGDTTEHLAGTLGCWVDDLAVPTFGLIGALLEGIGGLLGGLGGMLGMSDIFDPLGDMLAGLADVIADFMP